MIGKTVTGSIGAKLRQITAGQDVGLQGDIFR